MTQFDHIKLGRDIRDHVKAELKGMPGWSAYMSAHGWTGKSERITTPEIRQACVDLGLDLNAVCVSYALTNPTRAAPLAQNDAESDDLDRQALNVAIDERVEALIAKQEEGTMPVSVDGEVSYEGGNVQTLLDEALAPASAHLTPHLAGMLPSLVRPFIEAAVRGPRVVTQIVNQVIDESGAPVVASASFAFAAPNVVKRSNLYDAFKLRRTDAPAIYRHAFDQIKVATCDYANAPAIDPDYIWSPKALAQIAACDVKGKNGWVYGPAGIGKTDGLRQYAAYLKRPFFRIAIERTTEPAEIIGQEVPAKGGGMRWQDGKLTRAFRVPHAVILIDEPTLLRSGTLAVFQTALDQHQIYCGNGEVVSRAPGVFVCAADNTAGNGDDSGRYVDCAPLNAAFLDRFALKIPMTFLPESQEIAMLANRTGVHAMVSRLMVDYAKLTRRDTDQGKLTMGVSPRRLLAWADSVTVGIPSAEAFNASIVTGSAPEDREALIMLEGQTLRSRHDWIDGVTRGTIDPTAPEIAPHAQGGVSNVGAGFPNDADIVIDQS